MCVTWLLQSQENELWACNNEVAKNLLHRLLLFATDVNEIIRETTGQCIKQLFSQGKPSLSKLLSASISQLTNNTVENFTTKDTQKMFSLLIILEDVLKLFNNGASILSVARNLLKLLTMKHSQLSFHVFSIFTKCFAANDLDIVSSDSLSQLLQVLQNYEPTETKAVLQFIRMIEAGFYMLKKLDELECSTQLPTVFKTLLKYFEVEKAEIAGATADAAKHLISHCITDGMIHDTLAEINNQDESVQLTTPLAAIIESFTKAINYKNKSNLNHVIAIQEQLFQRIGKYSYPLLNKMLISMEQLYESADFRFQSSLEKAIATAISVMGPRHVLELLPLNLSGKGRPRTWMFPVLKKGIRNTSMGLFAKYFIPLASQFLNRSNAAAESGEKTTAKNYKNFYGQTYALLPGFCSYPTDFAQVFPNIAKHLGIILSQDIDLQPTICLSLLKAINLSLERINGDHLPENVEYSIEQAKATISTVANFAQNFLPLLFTVYGETSDQVRGVISETIATICKISKQALVDDYFKQVLKKLLEAAAELSKEDIQPQQVQELTHKRNIMVDLSLTIAPYLSSDTVQLLYQVFLPQLRQMNHSTQKKAYKAIYTICKKHVAFTQKNLQELLTTFSSCLPMCSDASKNYRTKCLMTFINLMSPKDLEMYLAQFLSEAILNIKGKNKKSKDSSYLFLRGLTRKCVFGEVNFDKIDETPLPDYISQEQQQKVFNFFYKLIAGLAANSDTMISGTIIALSNLLVEFSSYLVPIIPDILKSVFILVQYDSNDVILGIISFTKTCMAIIDSDYLKVIIPNLLPALVEHSSKKGAGLIRPKVTYLLEKLISKFGYEYCKSHFPQDKQSFIKNVWKSMKRESNKKETSKYAKKAKVVEDKAAVIKQDASDEPLDLLDPSMIHKIASKHLVDKKSEEDDNVEIKVNKQGKLVIMEDEDRDAEDTKKKDKKNKKRSRDAMEVEQAVDDFELDDELQDEDSGNESHPDNNKAAKRMKSSKDIDVSGQEEMDENRLAALRYLKKKQEERQRKKLEVKANLGEEYRPNNKRAGGDAKRSGKYDPYAYIPLDPKRLNKRHRNKSSDFVQFEKSSRHNRLSKKKTNK
jgi:ribosomal RNA-processing protein 12